MSDYETYIEGLGSTIPCDRVALECLLGLFDAVDDLSRASTPGVTAAALLRVVDWWRENNGVDDDVRNAVARWEDAQHERSNTDPDDGIGVPYHDRPDEKDGLR